MIDDKKYEYYAIDVTLIGDADKITTFLEKYPKIIINILGGKFVAHNIWQGKFWVYTNIENVCEAIDTVTLDGISLNVSVLRKGYSIFHIKKGGNNHHGKIKKALIRLFRRS